MASTSGTRGIRNKNPGNIDRTATKWQGASDDQSSDKRFVVFKDAKWGIRALAKTLLTYQSAHGIKTIRGIINRWAPPVENNTDAYVRAVARAVGVKPTDIIEIDNCEVMLPLVNAIIAHENNGYRYPDATVLEGLRLAGVHDVKPKSLFKQGAFQAQVGTALTLSGTYAVENAPKVKGWADQLSAFTASPLFAHAVTALITLAGILTAWGLVSQVIKQRAK